MYCRIKANLWYIFKAVCIYQCNICNTYTGKASPKSSCWTNSISTGLSQPCHCGTGPGLQQLHLGKDSFMWDWQLRALPFCHGASCEGCGPWACRPDVKEQTAGIKRAPALYLASWNGLGYWAGTDQRSVGRYFFMLIDRDCINRAAECW